MSRTQLLENGVPVCTETFDFSLRRARAAGHHRSGYVLVMTVMLLAVTSLIVAGIARHSMFHATSARRDFDHLKQKWAVASCQKFCLTRGKQILIETRERRFDLNIQLSGMLLHNRIEDESAKLDLNSIAEDVSEAELKSVIRDISSLNGLKIRLRPLSQNSNGGINRMFQSWGQIFESSNVDYLAGIRTVSATLSCWGNKLNVSNADEPVLRRSVKAIAGSIIAERMIRARQENPNSTLDQLLAEVEANDQQAAKLRSLLTSRSWATSVWTDAVSENKIESYFAVQELPVENIRRYQTIKW